MRKLFLAKFLLASFFALITLAVGSVARDWRAQGPIHVEGVRLRATKTEALSLLGPPVKAEDVPDDGDPMGIGRCRDLTYPGLRLDLAKAPGSAEFRVVRMIVTDASRRVSIGIGINVGDTKAMALDAPGKADGTPAPDDAGNPGAAWLPGNEMRPARRDDARPRLIAGLRVARVRRARRRGLRPRHLARRDGAVRPHGHRQPASPRGVVRRFARLARGAAARPGGGGPATPSSAAAAPRRLSGASPPRRPRASIWRRSRCFPARRSSGWTKSPRRRSHSTSGSGRTASIPTTDPDSRARARSSTAVRSRVITSRPSPTTATPWRAHGSTS